MRFFWTIYVLATVVFFLGCEPMVSENEADEDPTTAAEVQKEIREAADATAEFTAEKRDEYVRDMRRQLAKLDDEIAEMKEAAGNFTAEQQENWDATLNDLEAQRQKLGEKLDEVGEASADAWKDMQQGVAEAWTDLQRAVSEASQDVQREAMDSIEGEDGAASSTGEDTNVGSNEKAESPTDDDSSS